MPVAKTPQALATGIVFVSETGERCNDVIAC